MRFTALFHFYSLFLPLFLLAETSANQIPNRIAQSLLSSESDPSTQDLGLLGATIRDLSLGLRNGSLSSVDLVEQYLHNIKRDNIDGLELRAIIETAPKMSVLKIAEKLDNERQNGHTRGLLHGIPLIVKDNLATDHSLGMNTSAGSFALAGSIVPRDAFVIKRLRDAGAIVLGKANLNEMAGWKGDIQGFNPRNGNGTTNGWSARGGQCSSAYVYGGFKAGGDPLGSASGSAVGVSAGFAAGAIGTDLAGSMIRPAGRAALYSIRPTFGLVSRDGMIPISRSYDMIGPMGKSVWDVAAMLEVMVGADARDHWTHHIPKHVNVNYLRAAETPSRLKDFRFGLPRELFLDAPDGWLRTPGSCEADNRAAMRSMIHHLTSRGVHVETTDMPFSPDQVLDYRNTSITKVTTEFREDLETYLWGLVESPIRTLKELIDFNEEHSDIEMPEGECCQERNYDSLISPGRCSLANGLAEAKLEIYSATGGLDYLFHKHDVDALIFAIELGQPAVWVGIEGFPAGTVPLGYCDDTGNPFGLMIVVRAWQEEKLVRIMAAYEAEFPNRRLPEPLVHRK